MSSQQYIFRQNSWVDVRCRCGYFAPLKMSWSYANPGKRYRACPRYGGNDSCRYFEWMDHDVSERVAKVVPYTLVAMEVGNLSCAITLQL
nr:uncharacterized protein LOC109164785 [Ipomoea batatas]